MLHKRLLYLAVPLEHFNRFLLILRCEVGQGVPCACWMWNSCHGESRSEDTTLDIGIHVDLLNGMLLSELCGCERACGQIARDSAAWDCSGFLRALLWLVGIFSSRDSRGLCRDR